MAASFFFYDLETTGINPRSSRIMQFAGQRTDLELNRIGEPFNIIVKLTPDVVPEPDAILVTGITPQQTIQDGISEAEFLRMFNEDIVVPNTTFLGYNTLRFDDEFMRFSHYRNFYDAYEWAWCDGCSRWDLLDLVRLTRALRPNGIEWPVTTEGVPTNRLELLTKANGLDHEHAHDALNDVYATIAMAKLIRDKQPKLFEYQFNLRGKQAVSQFIKDNRRFIYSSGKFSNETEKTAAVGVISDQLEKKDTAIVWDLRHDPTPFLELPAVELIERYKYNKDKDVPPRLPIKVIKYNHCPAMSPIGLLAEPAVQVRLKVTPEQVEANWEILQAKPAFQTAVAEAVELLQHQQQEHWTKLGAAQPDVDGKLYDGFIGANDKTVSRAIRAAKPEQLTELAAKLTDERLQELLPLYKARNYPDSLSDEELRQWQATIRKRLLDGGRDSRLAKFFSRLEELAADPAVTPDKQFLLEELQLYGQSIMPLQEENDDEDEA